MSNCAILALPITVSIRIVADCVPLSCQTTRKLKRATTVEFTTVSAIIFIHCYKLPFSSFLRNFAQAKKIEHFALLEL